MKKSLLHITYFMASLVLGNMLSAQTTGTFIVTDKTNRMASCADTSITLADIFRETGIRDLHDPNDDVSKYQIKRLHGSVITEDIITDLKYSDHSLVYIEKKDTPFNGHNGLVIHLDLIQAPTRLFKKDTLKYTIEKGAKVSYTQDFFANFEYWSSGKDTEELPERMFFIDEANNVPVTAVGSHWTVGKGNYKIKVKVAVCDANDLMWDSISVIVTETPCSFVELRNLPGACRDQVLDLTSYMYVDGAPATATQLADLTFLDRSNVFNPAGGAAVNPTALDLSTMYNTTDRFPNIEIAYQPNVALGVCANTAYRFGLKVPSNFISTNVVFLRDNAGALRTYQIDGDYYGFNNSFKKDIFQKLFIAPYQVMQGTTFTFYPEGSFSNPVVGPTLSPGAYKAVAKHPDCASDSSVFSVTIKNNDFDIIWKSAQNIGNGYYTFTADEYPDADYGWMVWGGSIVAGLGTREITVYFSQEMSPAISARCYITLSGARMAGESAYLAAAVYVNVQEGKSLDALITGVDTETIALQGASIYPNPASESFAISGSGTYDLKVYDSMGRLVLQNTTYEAHIPIQVSSKGIHVVHINSNGRRQVLKVTVQ